MEAETGQVLTFNRSDKFYKSNQQLDLKSRNRKVIATRVGVQALLGFRLNGPQRQMTDPHCLRDLRKVVSGSVQVILTFLSHLWKLSSPFPSV